MNAVAVEPIVCVLNDYTVYTRDKDGREMETQALCGRHFIEAYAADYAAKGYRLVTPDYFNRGRLRVALQGLE